MIIRVDTVNTRLSLRGDICTVMLFLYENLGLFLVVRSLIFEEETCFDVEDRLYVARAAGGGSTSIET
jgi:hypothetical protein